ncbi:MAG: Pr6Pr family membrane protein [Candidatus Izemoplasmatales bacterium]|nr:Pr6Pr family membrane protein [Candidatus Izemoplasmatales bacterium]
MSRVEKSRKIYLVLFLLGAITGVVLQLIDSENPIQTMLYYTMMSNAAVIIYFGVALFTKNPSVTSRSVKAALTIAIMITFLVYHLVLAPTLTEKPAFWGNFFVHTFTPLMTLLDYFLFDQKGVLRTKQIPYWLIAPLSYFVFANIYAILGGTFVYENSSSRYPYFFMNPDLIGWGGVILFVLGISVFVLLLSWGYVLLDKKIAEEQYKTPKRFRS